MEEKELGSTIGLRVKEAVCGKDGKPGRIFGSEILTTPLAISHMQTRLVLRDHGAEPLEEEGTGVYLTNALTGWDIEPTRDRKDRKQTTLIPYLPAFKQEREASAHVSVRADENIFVILGDPPYNRYGGVAEDEEADLSAT